VEFTQKHIVRIRLFKIHYNCYWLLCWC